MKPTRMGSLAEFAAQPVGHYLAGPSWFNLCAQRDLWIQAIWGRPGVSEVGDLLESLKVQPFDGEPHAALLDCTALTHITLDDAQRLREFVKERQRILGPRSLRDALVCANSCMWLADRQLVDNTRCPSQMFSRFDDALAWLRPGLGHELRDGIGSLRSELITAPSLLDRLGRYLVKENLAQANVSASAKHLGCSRRSLQRALAQCGTSFRAELNHHRLERAKRDLESGASVTWIACELGFTSAQSFIRVFKRNTGVTPGVWRRHSGVEGLEQADAQRAGQ